jgi:hypothetical protein
MKVGALVLDPLMVISWRNEVHPRSRGTNDGDNPGAYSGETNFFTHSDLINSSGYTP